MIRWKLLVEKTESLLLVSTRQDMQSGKKKKQLSYTEEGSDGLWETLVRWIHSSRQEGWFSPVEGSGVPLLSHNTSSNYSRHSVSRDLYPFRSGGINTDGQSLLSSLYSPFKPYTYLCKEGSLFFEILFHIVIPFSNLFLYHSSTGPDDDSRGGDLNRATNRTIIEMTLECMNKVSSEKSDRRMTFVI